MVERKLPAIKAKELVKVLSKIGIIPVRQKGSHIQLKGVYKGELRYTTIPCHTKKMLPVGTLKGILRDCGLTADDLPKLLTKRKS